MNTTNFCIHLNSYNGNQRAGDQTLFNLPKNKNGDKNNVRNNIHYDFVRTENIEDNDSGIYDDNSDGGYYVTNPELFRYNAFQEDRSTPIYIINKYPYLNYQLSHIQVYKDNLKVMKSAMNYYFFALWLQKYNNILTLSKKERKIYDVD